MQKLQLSNIAFIIGTLAIGAFQMTSCTTAKGRQSTTKPATYPIAGLWIGTYTVDQQPDVGEQYFSFFIKPDRTIVVDTKGANQQHLAIGKWTLDGDVFSCNVNYVYGIGSNIDVNQFITAKWDKSGKFASGKWQNQNEGKDLSTGKFTMSRVN